MAKYVYGTGWIYGPGEIMPSGYANNPASQTYGPKPEMNLGPLYTPPPNSGGYLGGPAAPAAPKAPGKKPGGKPGWPTLFGKPAGPGKPPPKPGMGGGSIFSKLAAAGVKPGKQPAGGGPMPGPSGGGPLPGGGQAPAGPPDFQPPPPWTGYKPGPPAAGGPAAWNAPKASSRGGLDAALKALGQKLSIKKGAKATLGGPAGDNVWETLALGRFEKGFDPGAGQFVGKELSDTVFSPEQVNQMAQARAEPLVRALNDQASNYAATASKGGRFDPNRLAALKARAATETAGGMNAAYRDAQLDAAGANAAQARAAAENRRENFVADLEARLGLGRLGLDEAGRLADVGMERRGLDQTRDIERYRGDIGMRGQDLETDLGLTRINADRALARLTGELNARGQDIDESLGIGRLGLEARGQDLGAAESFGRLGLEARGQDIGAAESRARLGLEGWQTQQELQNAAAERQSRMQLLDKQLQDAGLDRQTRSELERERMTLQRELAELERSQRESEFSREFGQRGEQFEKELGERGRQFDAGSLLTREQGQKNRDLARWQTWQDQESDEDKWMRNLLTTYAGATAGDPQEFMRMLEEMAARGVIPDIRGSGGKFGSPLKFK